MKFSSPLSAVMALISSIYGLESEHSDRNNHSASQYHTYPIKSHHYRERTVRTTLREPTHSNLHSNHATDSHGSPVPTATMVKREQCAAGLIDCPAMDNCCPFGSYCTFDGSLNGACCPVGAVCLGTAERTSLRSIAPPPANTIVVAPASNAAARSSISLNVPSRVFGKLAQLFHDGSAEPVVEKDRLDHEAKRNHVESRKECNVSSILVASSNISIPSPDLELKFSGPMLYEHKGSMCKGACENSTNSASLPRPLRLFSIPVILVKLVKAAILPPKKNKTTESAPKVKFTGPNVYNLEAGGIESANRSQNVAGMLRPSRIFGVPVLLAKGIKAAVLPVNKYQFGPPGERMLSRPRVAVLLSAFQRHLIRWQTPSDTLSS